MNNQTSADSIYDTTIRLFILLGIIAWCILIMYPFMSIILWSLIIAIALNPYHKNLTKKIGGRTKLASFIIVLFIMVIIIIPSYLLISSIIDEVKIINEQYVNGTLAIPPPKESVREWPLVGEKLYDFWQNASGNLSQLILKYNDQLLVFARSIVSGILGAAGSLVQVILSIFLAGILLVRGGVRESIRTFLNKLFGKRGNEFADIIISTVGSVLKGVIGESFVIALLYGIVFFLADIPYAAIWTFLIFVLSVLQIPLAVISIPIMVYIFAVKETTPAIFWTIALILVGLVNKFLTPHMLGKGAPVPMPVIFIGVIGGFMLSGIIGVFTGAIMMSIGYTLLVGWMKTDKEGVKS